jgi:hypothetical protein
VQKGKNTLKATQVPEKVDQKQWELYITDWRLKLVELYTPVKKKAEMFVSNPPYRQL